MTRAQAAAKERRLQAQQAGVVVNTSRKNPKTPIKSESKVKEKIDTPSNFGFSDTPKRAAQATDLTKTSGRLVLEVGTELADLFPSDHACQDASEPIMQVNTKRSASEALSQNDPKIRRLASEPLSSSIPESAGSVNARVSAFTNYLAGYEKDDEHTQPSAPMFKQIANKTKQARKLMNNLDAETNKLREWMEERTEAQNNDFERRAAALRARFKHIKAQNFTLKLDLADAQNSNAANLQTHLAEAERELKELRPMKTKNEKLQSNNCNLQSDISNIMCEKAKLQSDNEKLRSRVGALVMEMKAQEREIAELKGKVEKVQQMLR